jgi:hypothetical protein
VSLAPNYIESIGVEMEGGMRWRDFKIIRDEFRDTNRFDWSEDGSVDVPNKNGYDDWMHQVELKYWSKDIEDVLYFGKRVWSLGFRQNSTCGNHHHFMFIHHPLIVSEIIASKEFIKMYEKEYEEIWGSREKYYDRMTSRWCSFYNISDEERLYNQIISNWLWGERYRVINFGSLVDWQGTIEIRIMPYASNFFEWRSQLLFNYNTINKIINILLSNRELKFEVDIGTIEIADLTPEEGEI